MTDKKQKIVMMAPSDLVPYEKNPRLNDGAVDGVAASILAFGFRSPIIVDRDHVIIAGHTRLKAAVKLGLREVPVIVADDLTEEQVKAYRLADNKVAEAALWDFDLLDGELADIDLDMSDFGFVGESPVFDPVEPAPRPSPPTDTATECVVSRYGVVIECEDMAEQSRVYKEMQAQGYRCHFSIA